MELEGLSLKELKKLERDVAIAIASYETRARAEAMSALEAKARELGFTLAELAEAAVTSTKRRVPVAVKFRNPANPKQTWSGRGRKPEWFEAAMAQGVPPDTLQA